MTSPSLRIKHAISKPNYTAAHAIHEHAIILTEHLVVQMPSRILVEQLALSA